MPQKTPSIEFEGVRIRRTPMMEQFIAAKEAEPGAIVFFRMGDFYELFFDDAKLAHRELNLTLTARNKASDAQDAVPMAGVPVRAVEEYIITLVERGYRVAVCDQLEDPASAKGIVDRGITKVVTPGTLVDERPGASTETRVLAAVSILERRGRVRDEMGLASIDVATGSFRVTEVVGMAALAAELQRLGAREVVVAGVHAGLLEPIVSRLSKVTLASVIADRFEPKAVLATIAEGPRAQGRAGESATFVGADRVKRLLKDVRGYGFTAPAAAESAVAAIVAYVADTQRGLAGHLAEIDPYRIDAFMVIDEATQANLEITETLRGGHREGSLVGVLDETVTAAGSRRLKTWLTYPLLDLRRIKMRHDAVEELVRLASLRETVRELLDETHDIERLTGYLATGRATPRHLVALRSTLELVPTLEDELEGAESRILTSLSASLDACDSVSELIASALVDAPPAALSDGGVIRDGFDADLDRVVAVARSGKTWILNYESSQRKETGISSLKVKYSKVFGYFIEVTRANLHLVPESYIRKQTLANSERYYTPELKEYEEEVLTADERRLALETEIFETVRKQVVEELGRLRHTASGLATLDVLSTLAEIAHTRGYSKPEMHDDDRLTIVAGRHPVVEAFLEGERFVPNDLTMADQGSRVQIITGPNMAGKSTVIRQAALIVLMAQGGSFVPAERASIGLVDRIFSRVGASDNLARGQSTFMVEMTETANILRHATSRSLIVLDEIGRGTSTYDGLSIAWAVAESLHTQIQARVLFATHYHELTELARTLDGVVNYSVAVKEWQQEIIFLRKLVEGSANRSYGIQVARLAGLPRDVIERAEEILHNLEMNSYDEYGRPSFAKHIDGPDEVPSEGSTGDGTDDAAQFSLFGKRTEIAGARHRARDKSESELKVLDELAHLGLDTTTPLQALQRLYAWQRRLKKR